MLLLHHHLHQPPRRLRLFRSASCCCLCSCCVIGFIPSERRRLFRRICVAMLSRNLELYANSAAAATTSNVSALRGDVTDSSNKINVAPSPPPGRSLLCVKDKIIVDERDAIRRQASVIFFSFWTLEGEIGEIFPTGGNNNCAGAFSKLLIEIAFDGKKLLLLLGEGG